MAEERRHPFDQPVAYPKNLRSHRWPNKAPEQLSDAEYVQEGIHMLVMSHFGHAKRWFAARLESSLHCRTCHTLAVFMIAVVHRSEREMLAAIDVAWEQEAFARSITTPEGRLLQADALLFGSMGQFLTGSYIKGAWNVRSCWKMYHDTWDELQQYHGPDREHLLAWCNFGVGSFNLFGSLLPPTALRFASWLFGLTGERQLGLRKLHNAQEANSFFSPFSAITLLMYYIIMSVFLGEQTEDELREAEDLLAWAKREYPGGTFFSLLQSRYYRCIGKLREAIEECERALAEVPKDLPPNFCIFFTYQKGWSAYLLMEWAESLDYFLPVLDLEDTPDHKTPPIKAFYAYQIGTSYAMLGEKEKALEMFSRVPNLLHPYVKARPIELYSIRKANQFFDTSISDPVLDTFELFMAWDGFANQSQELRYRSLCLLDEAARLHKVEIVPEQRVDFVDGVVVPARGGPSSHSDTLSKRVHAIYSTDSKVEPTAHKSAERAQLDGSHPSGLSETKEALVASAHVIHSSWETPDWNSSKKSRYHLTRAVILRSMNELNLALTELDSAIQAGLEADRSDQSKLVHLDGVLPFAYYQQGLVFLSQNRLADARKAHTLAAEYKDYDLFDAVQFRLHSMDQNIEKRERVFGSQ